MELEDDMVAVVTGAASGIGLQFSLALIERGLRVVVSDVQQSALDQVAGQFPKDRTLLVQADVSKLEDVIALRKAALQRFGQIDLLCNNAGVFARFAPTWEIGMAEWKWILDVNLWGVIYGHNVFLPGFIAQGSGHVVNVASLAGLLSYPGAAAYSASKHAVVAMTEVVQKELQTAGHPVGVTLVCPGPIHTGIHDATRNLPADVVEPAGGWGAANRIASPASTAALSPQVVAQQMIAAIESDRLYCATHAGFSGRVMGDRIERMLEELEIIPAQKNQEPSATREDGASKNFAPEAGQ